MSKKRLLRATKNNRVIALPGKTIKNADGSVKKQLYNIFKLS